MFFIVLAACLSLCLFGALIFLACCCVSGGVSNVESKSIDVVEP